jgi:hypothetical protein
MAQRMTQKTQPRLRFFCLIDFYEEQLTSKLCAHAGGKAA